MAFINENTKVAPKGLSLSRCLFVDQTIFYLALSINR